MNFVFLDKGETQETNHKQWWLSLTPAQRWQSNMEHLTILMEWNPDFFKNDSSSFVLQ